MKNRNPFAVFFLPFITFGIYSLVWEVKTKNEMKVFGADIPTAWLLIIPIVNWYWVWKYSQGVEKVTGGQTSGILAFVLLFLLGTIGMAIIQSEFNKIGNASAGASAYANSNPGQPLPNNSFGGPVSPGQQSPTSATVVPQTPFVVTSPLYNDPTNSGIPPTQYPPKIS